MWEPDRAVAEEWCFLRCYWLALKWKAQRTFEKLGTSNRTAPRHIAADLSPYRPGAISLLSYELLFKLSLVIYFNLVCILDDLTTCLYTEHLFRRVPRSFDKRVLASSCLSVHPHVSTAATGSSIWVSIWTKLKLSLTTPSLDTFT